MCVHNFSECINLKVKAIGSLEFELTTMSRSNSLGITEQEITRSMMEG